MFIDFHNNVYNAGHCFIPVKDTRAFQKQEVTEADEAQAVASIALILIGIALVSMLALDAITVYQEAGNLLSNIKDGIQNIKEFTSRDKGEPDNSQETNNRPSLSSYDKLQEPHIYYHRNPPAQPQFVYPSIH